ncbi:uncharacterized protein LOC130736889 [Lotus japonicus]|uniref:uncharacterized protein LOC130736889 n=1 Tax=Lotus japonicus TaxID=34305 RepID=UPI0025876452|nr:uncharacterized protein LOC130736889 [Lotus japonicus]
MTLKDTSTFTVFRISVVVASWTPPQLAVAARRRNSPPSRVELLEQILRKLTLFDYLKCRRVCRSWRHIVDEAVATKGTICSPAPQLPFLMLLPESLQSGTLSDITQEDTSYTNIAAPRTWKGNVDGVYSVEGWMVFQKFYYDRGYGLVMFFNPVSGEEFELPHLHVPLYRRSVDTTVYIKLVVSYAPNSSDFFVVACATILPYMMQQLAFCKVADKSWTLITKDEYGPTYFHQFVILDWKLYVTSRELDDSVSVTVFNLRDSNIITSERLVMLNPNAIPKEFHVELKDGVSCCTNESEVGITRDGDELFLVIYLIEHVLGNIQCELTKGFRIFKLDICGPRWIEIEDLGDRVLLIDDFRIQVISAKKINLRGKLSGGNCVFFSLLNTNTLIPDRGVFSLKDKSVKPLTFHPSLQDFLYGLWFMPSPLVVKQE